MTKVKIVVVENQYSDYQKIAKLSDEDYVIYPSNDEYIEFIDLFRIILNPRYTLDKTKIWNDLYKKIKTFDPDIFLIDKVLIGNHVSSNGLDVALKLRDLKFKQPIIILTKDLINKKENEKYFEITEPKIWLAKGYKNDLSLLPEYVNEKLGKEIKRFPSIILKTTDYISWENELINIKIGKEKDKERAENSWKLYENYIARFLNFIFYEEIEPIEQQKLMNSNGRRIDMFAHLKPNHKDILNNIIKLYSIKIPFLLCECKNIIDDLSNNDIGQILSVLDRKTHPFGIIFCRKKIQNPKIIINKVLSSWRTEDKMIVVLTDEDVLKILKLKFQNSEECTLNITKIFQEKISEILINK